MNEDIDYIYEIKFWSQIAGDHLRFFLDTLSIEETELIDMVTELRDEADEIYKDTSDVVDLLDRCRSLAEKVHELKSNILSRQICGNVKIALPPTFINHTLNEADQMISVLSGVPLDVDHLNKFWLQDAMGHADFLKCNLDALEKPLRKSLKKMKKKFTAHLLTNEELTQYSSHTDMCKFPRKDLHNERIDHLMGEFMELLQFLEEGKVSNTVLSSFSILVPDHMYREECYYLRKLGFDAPDPTVPRVEV